MKVTKQQTKQAAELNLPATPKALKSKAGKQTKTTPKAAPAPKAKKTKEPYVTLRTNEDVKKAGLRHCRGNDLVLGDGIKPGVMVQGKHGIGIAQCAVKGVGIGPTAKVIAAFKSNGTTKNLANGKVYPAMRAATGDFLVFRMDGKLVGGREHPKALDNIVKCAKVS